MSQRRKTIFGVITGIGVWMICELIIGVALPTTHPPLNTMDPRAFVERYRSKIEQLINGETDFIAFDRVLGWSHKPWGQGGIFRANGQGLRADRDYALEPAEGTFRVATFGDSFMLGSDVEVEKTWQALMENTNPALEVPNFGVSSYGTDQAVLRYIEEGRKFHPDIVVLSFISENAMRNLTTFRPFYMASTGLPLAKPRFRLENGELVLVENPIQSLEGYQRLLDHPEVELPRIGRWDEFYSQYESSTTPWVDNLPSVKAARFWMKRARTWWRRRMGADRRITDWYSGEPGTNPLLFKIFDRFHDVAVEDGAVPIFMLFPIHFDYRNAGPDGEMSYAPVVRFLEAKGYRFIDCSRVFRPYLEAGHSYGDLYAFGEKGGHYSPRAHRLIADAMEETVERLRPELSRESADVNR